MKRPPEEAAGEFSLFRCCREDRNRAEYVRSESTDRRRESPSADRLAASGHRRDGKGGQAGDRGQADRTGRQIGGGGAVRGHSVAGVFRHSLSTLFLEVNKPKPSLSLSLSLSLWSV